jgi:hypothetical protein
LFILAQVKIMGRKNEAQINEPTDALVKILKQPSAERIFIS